MNSLPERLHHAMQLRGIRLRKELAQLAGVSPASVTQWFNGDVRSLGADTLMKLARALRVRAEWLNSGRGPIEGDEVPSPEAAVWPFSFSLVDYKALPEEDKQEVEAIVMMKIKRLKTARNGSGAGSVPMVGGSVRMEEAVKDAAQKLIGGISATPRVARKVKRN